jgi:hypothetical protein
MDYNVGFLVDYTLNGFFSACHEIKGTQLFF